MKAVDGKSNDMKNPSRGQINILEIKMFKKLPTKRSIMS
jgi:hypothetical protein